MDKTMIEPFLIRAAIPEARTFPKEWERSNLLWDAVFRAHRDVLTGRKNVTPYSKEVNSDGVNTVVISLYNSILERALNGKKISSAFLIEDMRNKYEGHKELNIGMLQKLVNMTLKYLLILKTYNLLSDELILSEKDCDCPLDSIILPKIPENGGQKWTQILDVDAYKKLQVKIDNIIKPEGLTSRLAFDFANWQTLSPLQISKELRIEQEQ